MWQKETKQQSISHQSVKDRVNGSLKIKVREKGALLRYKRLQVETEVKAIICQIKNSARKLMDMSNHKENTEENQKKKAYFIQMNSSECNSILINLGCCLEGAYVYKTRKQYKSAQNLAQKDEIIVKMSSLIYSNHCFFLRDLSFLCSSSTSVFEAP